VTEPYLNGDRERRFNACLAELTKLQRLRAPKLFGTAGIRGSVRDKVTERFALDLARAVSTMLANTGQVAVASDFRTTSAELRACLLAGLAGSGTDALDAEVLSTPVLAFAVRSLRAESGIMVTASHNPPEDNGMKCYSHEGREYTPDEEQILEDLVHGRRFADTSWDRLGTVSRITGMADAYHERLSRTMKPFHRRLKIVVDCANGTTYNSTPLILSEMGNEVITLNGQPDGRFPGRPAEPNPANLATTCNFVRAVKADLGLAHDGDGDRLAVIDEKGRYINNDTVLAFFARMLLKQNGPGRIITTVDTSSRIDEVVRSSGGTVERTRLGKTHALLDEQNRQSIRLCCEPWKIIDPAWGFWGDAIYAACRLAQALDQTEGCTSALFRGIANYPQERFYFPCANKFKDAAMAKISEALKAQKGIRDMSMLDGVRLDFEDSSWMLVRKSGTEDKIRVYCEGRSAKRLRRLVRASSGIVRKAIKIAQRS
jgi:phosphoglucosamine mutase